jgi:hypothetical protein
MRAFLTTHIHFSIRIHLVKFFYFDLKKYFKCFVRNEVCINCRGLSWKDEEEVCSNTGGVGSGTDEEKRVPAQEAGSGTVPAQELIGKNI